MRIAFACDHAASEQREAILEALRGAGHEVLDFGTDTGASVDYPDHIAPAAEALARGDADRAVVMCGTGIGASIVANKIPGVLCARVSTVEDAEMARRHNDSNALALGARTASTETNLSILRTWLETPFDGGRHQGRVDKIRALDRRRCD
ncbi:RpiB/LacA/LacB family sugar-phosphate isomerase [Candidatus Sumerlaeota bacterium]|nr:RpiB/LacA/LacB family sugar-phosphate isomerase [Candidatus Sumerlaeota bacterium]